MNLTPLRRFLASVDGSVLVVHDGSLDLVEGMSLEGHQVREIHSGSIDESRRPGIVLIAHDLLALRTLVPSLPPLGRSRAIGCLLPAEGRMLVPSTRPEWPMVGSVNARRLGDTGVWAALTFAKPVAANVVFEQMARDAGAAGLPTNGGLFLAAVGPQPLPVDPGLLAVERVEAAADADRAVPPDVVLHPGGSVAGLAPHPVIDRAPTVVTPGDFGLGPVDEGVLNPIGYLQLADGDLLTLRSRAGEVQLLGEGAAQEAAHQRGATPAMVSRARPHRGVRVEWSADATRPLAAAVAGLAAAGIALVGETPDAARALLGRELCAVLDDPADLDDPLRREEHSVRLRRAALLEHATRAWRGRLAKEAGVAFRRFPTVSVLLATKRPDMVAHALRQVAKQRGDDVDLELVLVTHGFSVDPSYVREQVPGRAVHVHEMPEEAFFGDVLNAALDRASGDLVIKMDDDDWYGPDFIFDLLLAREYTGADLFGTTVEFAYLAPLDRTVRRNGASECAAKFVAGGSMMLGRSFLRELGGFRRVRKYVDAQLLAAVQSMGGYIYRGHGLGYMLRRNSTGHTWDPGIDYYLEEKRLARQWEGFVPSRILEFDEVDRPQPRVESDG